MPGVNIGLKSQKALKRLFDILVASVVLLLFSPVFIIIAIAIKLESKGPVFYRHKRVGKNGIIFELVKFRSMYQDCDDSAYIQYLRQLIESDREKNGNGLPYRKMETDPRVTRIGQFLRKYYLDELPQFWNILKGDMSLVGPRPHVQFEVDFYTEDQRKRLSVRPGATGIWQVTGKGNCSFNELIELDLQYIDQWNLSLDLKIIAKTLLLILTGGEQFLTRQEKKIPSRRRNGNHLRNNGKKPVEVDQSPIDFKTITYDVPVEADEENHQVK